MLLVVLNDKKASGLKAANVKKIAEKMKPHDGDIRITAIQKDGKYVVAFDNDLCGYAFGAWLNEHSVVNEVVQISAGDKAFGKKLAELLPNLVKELTATASPKAQLKREETIQMLVQAIINPQRSPFSLFK